MGRNQSCDVVPADLAEVNDALTAFMTRPTGRGLAKLFQKFRATRYEGKYVTDLSEDRKGSLRWIVCSSETKKVVGGSAGFAGIAGEDAIPYISENKDILSSSKSVKAGVGVPAIPAIPAPIKSERPFSELDD